MSSPVETLRQSFGGDIVEPGAAEYESVSGSVLVSGSPAYVLRPESVGDVQVGVRFAGSVELPLSVRGGGHAFAGFGTNDGGVVIDLSKLADVEIVDKEQHAVRVGGRVATIYPPETYHRLAAIKHQYDPGNLFARNHNIRSK
ncbi:FAD-binding protein [Streptomyces sp. SID13031]|uniref:FAD-binding protein n=1 Tax=Streptomyces sp. SID13031 TaxID=2706046 RepID=UPI0013C76D6B|nr:FAD-binding protein [Streptomyces sp. SID13031]NEA32666.1 FAD-binding oxidoreductase [Streptomyces sp. SID13031]